MPLPDLSTSRQVCRPRHGEEGGRGEAAGELVREPLVEGRGSVWDSRSSSERPLEDLLDST